MKQVYCWLLITVAVGIVVQYSTHCVLAQEGEAPAAEGGGDAAKEGGHEQVSGIVWVIKTSGAIGLLILGLSIYFVALVIRLFMELRKDVCIPPDILGRCADLIKSRDFPGVYTLVRESDSVFSRVLATGIAELPNGLSDAREAMERVGEAETVEMEKKISMLAVMGTLGPMIGLIGTLKGMIASFSVIAMSGVALKASQVAEGISEALILTFEGVSLSVPAIFFFAFFKNRVSTISVTAMLEADQLLRHFYRTGRSKGQAAGAAAAGARSRGQGPQHV